MVKHHAIVLNMAGLEGRQMAVDWRQGHLRQVSSALLFQSLLCLSGCACLQGEDEAQRYSCDMILSQFSLHTKDRISLGLVGVRVGRTRVVKP